MVSKLVPLSQKIERQGPVVVVVMDGVGIAPSGPGNAISLAEPKNLYSYMDLAKKSGRYVELKAHGPAVGLPSEDDMGNSEVGHNAIGSGQIFAQGAKLVNISIDDGSFFKTESWEKVVVQTSKKGGTIHFMGLLSDGNVHSHIDQLFKMLDGAAKSGAQKIRIHALLDGRDVSPTSGAKYLEALEKTLSDLRSRGVDAQIASGGGRMHMTMDRYGSDWPMVQKGWNAHVHGIVEPTDINESYKGYYESALAAYNAAYAAYPDKKDQYHPTFVIVDRANRPVGKIVDGDAVINFNFRGDRALQISSAFEMSDFTYFDRGQRPNVLYAGLLEYDSEAHIPSHYLVPPPTILGVSGEYLAATGIRSYVISETHKFGHMTYFWNGNKTGYIDEKLETYKEITSDPNSLVESRPSMKAVEITNEIIAAIDSEKFDFLRINYPNGDMVGHTGNIGACVESIKTLDLCLKQLVDKVMEKKGIILITADHGNSEEKLDKKGKPMTSHTLNPVPCLILDSSHKNNYVVSTQGISVPGIANITATFINLLGYKAPSNYEKSLIAVE